MFVPCRGPRVLLYNTSPRANSQIYIIQYPLKIPTGKDTNQLAIYEHGGETEFKKIEI